MDECENQPWPSWGPCLRHLAIAWRSDQGQTPLRWSKALRQRWTSQSRESLARRAGAQITCRTRGRPVTSRLLLIAGVPLLGNEHAMPAQDRVQHDPQAFFVSNDGPAPQPKFLTFEAGSSSTREPTPRILSGSLFDIWVSVYG